MDEVLRTLVPLVSGVIIALIGFYAVHQQNVTQRENLKLTTASRADQQRKERLTEWRRDRYGELSAAVAEFNGAVRSMNLALGTASADYQNQAAQDRLLAALNRFMEVDMSSRILQALLQVADKDVAELAQKLADEYFLASSNLVRMAVEAKLPADEKRLAEESGQLKKRLDDTSEMRYELNRRIEKLVSEGD